MASVPKTHPQSTPPPTEVGRPAQRHQQGGNLDYETEQLTSAHLVQVETGTSSPQYPIATNRWADVLFTFVAELPDELTIEKHDCVRVLDKHPNKLGWWYGECNGKTGLFPSNYVREITG